VLPSRVRWAVMIVAMLTMAVSFIDRQTLSVLGPTITPALHLSETQFGLLGSAFAFGYLFATPLGGLWIDRIGARRGLVRSVAIWSVVAALHAIAPGFGSLVVLRISLALAEGPGFPGSAQTAQRLLPLHEHPRAFGLLFSGSSIGVMLAPKLVKELTHWLGWQGAFVGTAAIGLLWIPLWIAVTRSPQVRTALDARPAVSRAARPSYLRRMRDPWMIRAVIGIIAIAPVGLLASTWGAKYLAGAWHLTQDDVATYLWLPPLALDAGNLLFGDLASRVRRRTGERGSPRVLYAIAMTSASAVALLPLCTTPWQGVACIAVGVGGMGGVYTLCTSDLIARCEPRMTATVTGLVAAGQSIAHIAASPLIGLALDHHASYGQIGIALGAWAIPGSLIWLAWRPREPELAGGALPTE